MSYWAVGFFEAEDPVEPAPREENGRSDDVLLYAAVVVIVIILVAVVAFAYTRRH